MKKFISKLSKFQIGAILLIPGIICIVLNFILFKNNDFLLPNIIIIIIVFCLIYTKLCLMSKNVPIRKCTQYWKEKVIQVLNYDSFFQLYYLPPKSDNYNYESNLIYEMAIFFECIFLAKLSPDNEIILLVKDKKTNEIIHESRLTDYKKFYNSYLDI